MGKDQASVTSSRPRSESQPYGLAVLGTSACRSNNHMSIVRRRVMVCRVGFAASQDPEEGSLRCVPYNTIEVATRDLAS